MQDFEAKRKNLFQCLDAVAETNLKGTILDQTKQNDQQSPKKPFKIKNETFLSIAKFRGSESFFKKPELPITKCLKPRVVPDFRVNPQKWTKYSLDDADISDRMNTAAAFTCLRELELKREENESQLERIQESLCSDSDSDSLSKVVFNKSAILKRSLKSDIKDRCSEDQPKFKGSKLIMPEYVVGKSANKNKKHRIKNSESRNEDTAKTLKLSHLLSFDEDELDNVD